MIMSKDKNYLAKEASRNYFDTEFTLYKKVGNICKDGSIYLPGYRKHFLYEGKLLFDLDGRLVASDLRLVDGSLYDLEGHCHWDNEHFKEVFDW